MASYAKLGSKRKELETTNKWDAMAERLAAANVAPPQTLLGVARLAFPELKVELEATAATEDTELSNGCLR